MRRDRGEIGLRRQKWRRQRAAGPHLPDPQHGRNCKRRESEPEVGERQAFSVDHRRPFRRRPA